MKKRTIYLILVLISSFSQPSFSQEKNLEEQNQLKFENHFFEALKYKANGNYVKAITELEACREIDSDNVALNFEFSKNYLFQKKYFEAEHFANEALKKDALNSYILEHLKEIFVQQQDYVKAIEIQQKIIKLNRLKEEDLIVLYIQNNEIDKANELVKKLEEKGLLSSKIKMYYKGITTSNKTTTTQAKEINTSLESLKNDFESTKKVAVLKQILELELKNNQIEQLVKDSNDGLEIFPAQPAIYLFNAIGLNKQLKYIEAIESLNNGIDFVIDNQTLLNQFYDEFATSYQGLGNQQKANEFKAKSGN